MSTDTSSSFSPPYRPGCRPDHRRWIPRLGLGAALALGALGGGCAEEPPADPSAAVPDAGPACDPGTRGCTCPCQDDLLCIAGRCLETEGRPEPAPQPVPRPRPTPPSAFDAGSTPSPAPSDAGATVNDGPDAEAPDASS